MRHFFQSHWKAILAIILAIVLAVLTVETAPAFEAPPLSARLRAHVEAIVAKEPGAAGQGDPERSARHIESALARFGYQPRRQDYEAGGRKLRQIAVSVAKVDRGAKPARIFIVGVHHDPASSARDEASGTAAVLELARLLKTMQPSGGTEVRLVFFVNEAAGSLPDPRPGNFIAFAGTQQSSARVRQSLAAFQADSEVPPHGLAAPAHAMGVTLSDHASLHGQGYPALLVTDTAFLRYPYYRTAGGGPDEPDYEGMARVVTGLARTLTALAGVVRI